MIEIKQIIEEIRQNMMEDKQLLFSKLVENRLNRCLEAYYKNLQKAYSSLEAKSATNPMREMKRVWGDKK
mgnify:FL=1